MIYSAPVFALTGERQERSGRVPLSRSLKITAFFDVLALPSSAFPAPTALLSIKLWKEQNGLPNAAVCDALFTLTPFAIQQVAADRVLIRGSSEVVFNEVEPFNRFALRYIRRTGYVTLALRHAVVTTSTEPRSFVKDSRPLVSTDLTWKPPPPAAAAAGPGPATREDLQEAEEPVLAEEEVMRRD